MHVYVVLSILCTSCGNEDVVSLLVDSKELSTVTTSTIAAEATVPGCRLCVAPPLLGATG